jgi:hypothetical protein
MHAIEVVRKKRMMTTTRRREYDEVSSTEEEGEDDDEEDEEEDDDEGRRAPFDPIQEGKWCDAAAGSWIPLLCSNDAAQLHLHGCA